LFAVLRRVTVGASQDRPKPDEMRKLASIGKGHGDGSAGIGPHTDSQETLFQGYSIPSSGKKSLR
jgi:hypothetical protein